MAMDSIIHQLAQQEQFVPTMIANAPPAGELVIGDCRYLAAGQALMIVGGYVVRDIKLAYNKRAKAIRRQTGEFDVVPPSGFGMAMFIDAPASPVQTPGATSSQRLPIIGTPSPISAILPMLEAQAAEQARPTVPAAIQHFEQLQQQQLPQQQQQQQAQRQQTVEQQQETDNVVTERLRQIALGKRQVEKEQTPSNNDHDDGPQQLVNTLLERVQYLEGHTNRYTNTKWRCSKDTNTCPNGNANNRRQERCCCRQKANKFRYTGGRPHSKQHANYHLNLFTLINYQLKTKYEPGE